MKQEEFILVIRKHASFGLQIHAYMARKDDKLDCLKIAYMLSKDNMNDTGSSGILTEEHKKVIRLIDEFNDRTLTKLFAKKKTPQEFLLKVDEKLTESLIRPYIEKRLAKICSIAIGNSFNLFYCEKKAEHVYPIDQVLLHDLPAKPIFNFIKDNNGLKYFLSISQNGREINLFQKKGSILVCEPCILLLENNLYCFQEIDSKKLSPFFTKKEIIIPESAEQKYFETFILNSIAQHEVQHSGFDIVNNFNNPRPILRLETNIKLSPCFCIDFKYGEKVVTNNSKQLVFVELTNNGPHFSYLVTKRNKNAEMELVERLLDLGLVDDGFQNLCLINIDLLEQTDKNYHTISWINKHYSELIKYGFEITTKFDNKNFFLGQASVDIQTNNTIDWFDINAVAVFGEYSIPFIKLKKYILNNEREVILPNGDTAIIPAEWFAKYKDLLSVSVTKNDLLSVKSQYIGLIGDLELQRTSIAPEAYMLTTGDGFDSYKESPSNLKAELRKYQHTGFQWLTSLANRKLNGLLADDMGLGKTLQTITTILDKHNTLRNKTKKITRQIDLFNTEEILVEEKTSSLIIAPTSLIYNWANEFSKFAPDLKINIFHASANKQYEGFLKADVYITTYGMIRNELEYFKSHTFLYIVLDESQNIKNPSSKLFQSVIELKAEHKISLSGTPIENSLTDLWAQMNFLNPGILGTQQSFDKEYVTPIQKEGRPDITNKLKKIITPFILRRKKEDVCTELPPIMSQIITCEMLPQQEKLYKEEISKIRNLIIEKKRETQVVNLSSYILKAIMSVRQIANHPKMFDPKLDYESGKFEEIASAIDIVLSEGHKVLIFSSFVKHLELVEEYICEKNYRYSKITGQTQERLEEVEKFQNDEETNIFLISLKAGGTGLNLTAADYVFILDPWWNEAAEIQAISRAHRIGQTKNIFVYRFISINSVEERIMQLQQNKRTLASSLIEGSEIIGNLELEEIIDLFETN